jgi:hypothetical protein
MSSELCPNQQVQFLVKVVATREFGSVVGRLAHITGPWKAIKNKFVVVLLMFSQ